MGKVSWEVSWEGATAVATAKVRAIVAAARAVVVHMGREAARKAVLWEGRKEALAVAVVGADTRSPGWQCSWC